MDIQAFVIRLTLVIRARETKGEHRPDERTFLEKATLLQ